MNQKFLLLLIFMASITGYSQEIERPDDVELLIQERKQLTVVTEPATLEKGFFRAGSLFTFSYMDKSFSKDGHPIYKYNSFLQTWSVKLILEYGVSNRFQLSATIPYEKETNAVSHQLEVPQLGTYQPMESLMKGKGIGDVTLTAAYQILKPKINVRFLTLYLDLTSPTGKSDVTDENSSPIGNGYFDASINLNYDRIFHPFRLAINPGYIYSFPAKKVMTPGAPGQEYKKGDIITCNVHLYIMLNEWISLLNGIGYGYGYPDKLEGKIIEYPGVDDLDNSGLFILAYLPAISFQIKYLRLNQTLYVPITGKNVSANIAYMLRVNYVF